MWNNISNIAAIIKNKMVRNKFNDLDLIPFAARDTDYDGNYRDAAILPKDLVASADVQNTGFYELQLNVTNVVTVTTQKGIIDITKINDVTFPDEAFGSAEVMYINNPELDLTVTNRENIYIQYSVHYSPASADNAIPYVLATGAAPTGLEFSIFNASPLAPGGEQWEGAFYLYYELYTI